jgi:release factor glutamine methyltransferase
MRVVELIRSAVEELAQVGIEGSETDVNLLLGHCLNKTRTELFLAAYEEVPETVCTTFFDLLRRRKRREPLAYILGEREFWSLPFFVSQAVLIPRPETEFLVEQVLIAYRKKTFPKGQILDLCCGSGAIAVVLARELERDVTAVDLSAPALAVAKKNCSRHLPADRVNLIQADLLSAFANKRMFSLVVSNPPYLSSNDVRQNLEPEVACYEPHLALDGGEHGLDVIERIRDGLPPVMAPGGEIFIEIGADQGEKVRDMFMKPIDSVEIFQNIAILKDYAGRDRVLHATINEEVNRGKTWKN